MKVFNTIALKMVKVLKLAKRKLMQHRSIIGFGAFRKIKYFGDLPRQLLCIRDLFDHKVKIIQNMFLLSCFFTILTGPVSRDVKLLEPQAAIS